MVGQRFTLKKNTENYKVKSCEATVVWGKEHWTGSPVLALPLTGVTASKFLLGRSVSSFVKWR